MLFRLRSKDTPWEVVDRKTVDPIPMYDEDEDLELDNMSDGDTCGTYVFDVKHRKQESDLRNAVLFARQQLLQEVAKKDYNLLLLESWDLTVYRRGKHYRIEVQYCGRPAHALGKLPASRPPPFMEVLKDCVYS